MSNYIYILVMALTVFAIRVIPLTLLRKKINNRFFVSFLYYVPYVTLAVMTFPAIIDATEKPLAGLCALVLGIFFSYKEKSMFFVTCICCITVLILELI